MRADLSTHTQTHTRPWPIIPTGCISRPQSWSPKFLSAYPLHPCITLLHFCDPPTHPPTAFPLLGSATERRKHTPSQRLSATPEGAPQSAPATGVARGNWGKKVLLGRPLSLPTTRRPVLQILSSYLSPGVLGVHWFRVHFSGLEAALSGQPAPLLPLPSPTGVCPAAKRALPGKYISYCTVWEGHDLGNCSFPSLTPALLPPSNLLRTLRGAGEASQHRRERWLGGGGAAGREGTAALRAVFKCNTP